MVMFVKLFVAIDFGRCGGESGNVRGRLHCGAVHRTGSVDATGLVLIIPLLRVFFGGETDIEAITRRA